MDVHIYLRQRTRTRHLGFSLVRQGLLLVLWAGSKLCGCGNTANNLVFEAPKKSKVALNPGLVG